MFKKLARWLLGDYAPYQIYARASLKACASDPVATREFRVGPVDVQTIACSPDRLIRDQIAYAGLESLGYACFHEDRIIAICFYWYGQRYLSRNFWPLDDREAKLVQIISLPEMRGRGAATALIRASCDDMMQHGFACVYARVWYSNTSSKRAFERAGWKRIAFVLEINPLRWGRPLRICIRTKVFATNALCSI